MSDTTKKKIKKKRSIFSRIRKSFRLKKSDSAKSECKGSRDAYRVKVDDYKHASAETPCVSSKGTSVPPVDKSGVIQTEVLNKSVELCARKPCSMLNHNNDSAATRKLLIKEKQLNDSDDSDYSVTGSDLSDDDDLLIQVERNEINLKEDYFTVGKYITYFFLAMERQSYDPNDVYTMIQYQNNDTELEKGTCTSNYQNDLFIQQILLFPFF